MTYQTLTVEIDARGVASVALNTPEKRNALCAQMMDELTHVASDLGVIPDVRAVVLSGTGAMFCAGGDLNWMKAQVGAPRAHRIIAATKLAMMLQALNEMPKPLIGRIHGGAFGGGIGLACICDVAIAQSDTKFGFTETKLGLIPATIGPYVVARMGEGHARRVFMSSRIFDAAEACDLGIVADVVNSENMDAAIAFQIAPYLCVAPQAVGAAKALARSLSTTINADVIADTITRLADTWDGEEAHHGIASFLAKTKPRWS
jgi:methylglutaconyl-CoA hydratase